MSREHGGLTVEELRQIGVGADRLLDLSVNVNPYGPCASVRKAVFEAAIERYPDPTATDAREALAARADVDARRVVVTNGAARDATSFGLPHHLRIAAPPSPALGRFRVGE